MDCRIAIEYINMHVDNMLGEAEEKELIAHLRCCESCQKELEYLKALKNAVSRVEQAEPPAGLALSAIKKARKRRIPAFAYASAGAAAVIVLLTVFSSGILDNGNNMIQEKVSYSAMYGAAEEAEKMQSIEAPQAAPAATPAPDLIMEDCATLEAAAPEEDGAERAAGVSAYSITVSAERSENFRDKLASYIEKYDIEIEQEDNIISFYISEQHIDELKVMLEDAGIDYEDNLVWGLKIEFIFE